MGSLARIFSRISWPRHKYYRRGVQVDDNFFLWLRLEDMNSHKSMNTKFNNVNFKIRGYFKIYVHFRLKASTHTYSWHYCRHGPRAPIRAHTI